MRRRCRATSGRREPALWRIETRFAALLRHGRFAAISHAGDEVFGYGGRAAGAGLAGRALCGECKLMRYLILMLALAAMGCTHSSPPAPKSYGLIDQFRALFGGPKPINSVTRMEDTKSADK